MNENVDRRVHYLHKIIQWLIIVGVLALMVVGVINIVKQQTTPKLTVAIGNTTVQAEVVDTPETREKGLGGRSSISSERAMLFVFDSEDKWTIWMKGMKFPIDIVWLDSEKQVIHVAEHVQPDAEPYVKYAPESPARYVLELQAGKVEQAGVKIGTQVGFSLDREEQR